MNFKNSDFFMLLVAFLVGYFFQDITGMNFVEGIHHRAAVTLLPWKWNLM